MSIPVNAANPLSRDQVRALATVMRKASGSADNFLTVVFQAKNKNGGRIAGEDLWHQIAREMAVLEAGPSLFRRQLRIAAGAMVVFAVTAMCLARTRLHWPLGL